MEMLSEMVNYRTFRRPRKSTFVCRELFCKLVIYLLPCLAFGRRLHRGLHKPSDFLVKGFHLPLLGVELFLVSGPVLPQLGHNLG